MPVLARYLLDDFLLHPVPVNDRTVDRRALCWRLMLRRAGLFLMGFSFQMVGTAHYLYQGWALQCAHRQCRSPR